MELIYNPRNRTIRDSKDNSEEINLTKRESKLIEVLCNNRTIEWDEMNEYLYGIKNDYSRRTIYTIKTRLFKKLKLNIKLIRDYGIRLYDQIYIE